MRQKGEAMGSVKRAFLSLKFYKKKNVLLILLMGGLFCLLFLVLTVSMASRYQVMQMRDTVGSSVVVQKKVDGSFLGTIGTFYEKEKEALTGHPLVRDFNLVTTIASGNWKDLEPYYIDEEKFLEYKAYLEEVLAGYPDRGYFDKSAFFGVTNSNDHALFAGGGYRIVEGQPIRKEDEDKHVILISDVVAEKNGLHAGDKIVITSSDSADTLDFEEEVTVQGIFTYPANEAQEQLSYKLLDAHPANYSFLPEALLTDLDRMTYPIEQIFVYLEDMGQLDTYIQDMNESIGETVIQQGVQYRYDYYWDEDWYEQISAPFRGISRITGVMAVMIGAGVYVILLLLCAWMLRGKLREMGIVFAMGEKKGRIAVQLLTEELVPIFLAMCLGAVIALLSLDTVSERVLDQSSGAQINMQLEGQRDEINRYESNGVFELRNDFLGEHFTVYRAPEKLYVSDGLEGIVLCVCAGAAVLIVSLMIQVWFILRKNPSEVMLSGE